MSKRFPVKDHCKIKLKQNTLGRFTKFRQYEEKKKVSTLNTKTDMWRWRFKDRPQYGLRKTLFRY